MSRRALPAAVALVISLSACTAGPSPEPSGSAAPTCPDGLAAALETSLADVPLGPDVPDEVGVIEFPDYAFAASVLGSVAGCVLGVERHFPDRLHVELVGLTNGLSAQAVGSTLAAAGWAQPDADAHPGVWHSSDRMSTVSLSPGGVEPPVLGVTVWGDYVDADDAVFVGTIDF